MARRIGILTGGGDCPGLNAAIRAVARRALDRGDEVVGIREGWLGLMEGRTRPLHRAEISGLLPRGGTILGTTGMNPYFVDGGAERAVEGFGAAGLDAIVAVGGDGTLRAGAKLHAEHGLPVVGLPKTIDNDVGATDYTVGFDTAVEVATEAVDRLHTTAESHNRVMVVEVMGRRAGWIAVWSGLAAGADCILIPEHPLTIEAVCEGISRSHERGKTFSILVVAEGYELTYASGETRQIAKGVDDYGFVRLGGIGAEVAREIEERTGFATRVTVLGHVLRGGTPTARDRVRATRFGVRAAELVDEGRFGTMVALQGDRIVAVPLEEALAATPKLVPREWFEVAQAFFG
jgi:6-phosphofructokinase 1